MHVALFAGVAVAAGSRQLEIEWQGGTVADLRRMLARRWPAVAPLLARSAVAVGGRYAADDERVPQAAEVAVIPPVSGG